MKFVANSFNVINIIYFFEWYLNVSLSVFY